MSLDDGRPPYSDYEIGRLARDFVSRLAWGCWLGSDAFIKAFQRPLVRDGGQGYLAMAEGGAIYAYGYQRPGRFFLDNAMPEFDIFRWLDVESTKKCLLRARELEWIAGSPGRLPLESEIIADCELREKARIETLPHVRTQISKAGARRN